MSRATPTTTVVRDVARARLEKLPRATIELGRELYHSDHLISIELRAHKVIARVRSSQTDRQYRISGELGELLCTCAHGAGCKHTAAVLFALSGADADAAPAKPRAVPGSTSPEPSSEPPPRARRTRTVTVPPRGVLKLHQEPPAPGTRDVVRYATLSLRYGAFEIDPTEPMDRSARTLLESPTERVVIERDEEAEAEIARALRSQGLTMPFDFGRDAAKLYFPDPSDWIDFVLEGTTELRALDIDVVPQASFTLKVVELDDFDAKLESSGTDWFALDVGVRVGTERLDLVPVLLKLLRSDSAPKAGQSLFVPLPSGALARVPYERFAPLVDVLLDLVAVEKKGRLVVPRLRAMELAEGLGIEGQVATGLRALRASLARTKSLPTPEVPPELRVELRDYQREGYQWLTFLGEHGIGGVLADDMGLGKTLQLIALVCARRNRAVGAPSLVVAPTSVLLAWVEQLEQFAPHLTVVRWHGKERFREHAQLTEVDLVLTSYALLCRDLATLGPIEWDVLILDEAQAIKNPDAVAGEAARSLKARQRVAVTGTPLENHLGELWSIVSFAAPGVLGSEKAFKKVFRTPIEKLGNTERLAILRRRVTPLLLRRTKEEVARELPPKTIIDVPIELEDEQRDLYETVRHSVDSRVRDEIARRGFAMSRIAVLDALLKLRQVCCDPSLLKLTTSKKHVPSAKREGFRDLIETLVGEGRRVLVFSQFVEMLELLAADLRRMHIAFSLLTGSTVDRDREVRRFQDGVVPVFLISLKAGGVGLNLTAADTVIHYDPWWNPAVEAQATDRVHRIGQTKPVFIHRLITKGTVEEKIVALQVKKAELARALLDDGVKATDLDEAVIADLLAPIPRA